MADDDQFEIRILMKNGASTYFSDDVSCHPMVG